MRNKYLGEVIPDCLSVILLFEKYTKQSFSFCLEED